MLTCMLPVSSGDEPLLATPINTIQRTIRPQMHHVLQAILALPSPILQILLAQYQIQLLLRLRLPARPSVQPTQLVVCKVNEPVVELQLMSVLQHRLEADLCLLRRLLLREWATLWAEPWSAFRGKR